MRRSPGALRHLLGRSSTFARQAAPLVSASLEPLAVPAWQKCARLGGGSHWRSFGQQVRAEQEQEPVTSSKASSETAEKEDAKADAEANANKAEGETESEAKKTEGDEAEAGKAEAKAAEAEAEVEVEELSPIERLNQELEELQDKSRAKKKELLLGLADFQNNNKKSMKERESRRRSATANFARRMVDVYDEFEELPAFNREVVKEEGSPVLALQEGVSLTRQLFNSALEKSNIERLSVELGSPVVNARHEIVGSTSGDGAKDSIAEVIADGWVMDLRSSAPQVLRKAKVKTF